MSAARSPSASPSRWCATAGRRRRRAAPYASPGAAVPTSSSSPRRRRRSATVSWPRCAAAATRRRRRAHRTPRGGCSTADDARLVPVVVRRMVPVRRDERPHAACRHPACSSSGVSAARRPVTSRPSSPASTRRPGEPSTSPPSPPRSPTASAPQLTLIEVVGPGPASVDVPPSAHVSHVAAGIAAAVAAVRHACRPGARLTGCSASSTRRPSSSSAPGDQGAAWPARLVRRAPCPVLVVPDCLQHLGERVALLRVAGVVAAAEPRHALLRRPVGEAVLVDLLPRLLLDGVVADR